MHAIDPIDQETPPALRKVALSVAEASVEAGVSRDQIYTAIRSGDLIARKWGRRTIIRRADLDDFLAALPPLRLPAGT